MQAVAAFLYPDKKPLPFIGLLWNKPFSKTGKTLAPGGLCYVINEKAMRKLVAAINMTIDGNCDHTAGLPNEELHQHYAGLLLGAGAIFYGRKTYQLMEYWKTVLKAPTGNSALDGFATAIDRIPKLVFSRTLKSLDWETATLLTGNLEEEVLHQKNRPGNDLFVGSPGLISQLTEQRLIDEYQFCIHPVIAGEGLPLFKNICSKILLQILQVKTFAGGAVILYYAPVKQ